MLVMCPPLHSWYVSTHTTMSHGCLQPTLHCGCFCESYLHVKISKLALNHEIILRAKFFWSMVSIQYYCILGMYPHTPPCNGGHITSTQCYLRHILQNKPATRIPNYAADQTKNIFMLKYYHFQTRNFYIYFGSLSV